MSQTIIKSFWQTCNKGVWTFTAKGAIATVWKHENGYYVMVVDTATYTAEPFICQSLKQARSYFISELAL